MILHPYTGREHSVPCRHFGCPITTWRDDAFCVRHAPTGAVAFPPTGAVGGSAARGGSALPPGSDLASVSELRPGNVVKVAGEWAGVVSVIGERLLLVSDGREWIYTPTVGERFVWHEGAF